MATAINFKLKQTVQVTQLESRRYAEKGKVSDIIETTRGVWYEVTFTDKTTLRFRAGNITKG